MADTIEKIESAPVKYLSPHQAKSKNIQLLVFRNAYSTKMDLFITSGQFKAALGLVDAIEKGLIKFKDKIDIKGELEFYFQLYPHTLYVFQIRSF